MIVPLSYGKKGMPVRIPEDCRVTVIQKPVMPLIRDLEQTICSRLNSGVGSPSLREVAKQCKSACILVCDITRPVPNNALLPPILNTLLEAGISKENILLLIATGLHRPNVGPELHSVLGDDPIFNSVRIENHYARANKVHVDLGRTTKNTPIKLDRRFVQADLKLVTGLVEPHFMAGYSGGRKVIAPGIAHEDTIRTLHNAKFLSDPDCSVCEVDANPLHNELLAIIERLRLHSRTDIYGVNVVIDAKRRLSFINFGEIEVSHREAITYSHQYSSVKLDRKYPIVLSTAAGYPLDQTYYQAIKGLVTPLDIIEPQGTLILAAECKEGLGSLSFQKAQQQLCQNGTESFLQAIKIKSKAAIDEWSTQMLVRARQRANILLFSDGLPQTQHKLTGVQQTTSIEQSLQKALHAHERREIAVIPEGPYVVPRLNC